MPRIIHHKEEEEENNLKFTRTSNLVNNKILYKKIINNIMEQNR